MAGKGNPEILASLQGPACPEELEYLLQWARELHGRSGVSLAGFVPLTYETIDAWSRLKQVPVTPAEVDALLLIDAVLLTPVEKPADG